MGIAEDVQAKMKDNNRTIFITDADDLLAAWQFQRHSSPKRSRNLCMVPTEWRYSAPPDDKCQVTPFHVTYRCKSSHSLSTVKPAQEYSTIDCHGGGRPLKISVPDLNAMDTVSFARRNLAPWPSPILDMHTLALVLKDLGINAKATPMIKNGRQYIALSGYAGLRNIMTSTFYRADNRKIIRMAIGSLGVKNMVKVGGLITIGITVPLTILDCYLQDHTTLPELVGNLASELIKIGTSSIVAALFGLAAGTFTAIAAAPIATVIVIGIGMNFGLNVLDDHYQLTDKLIKSLDKMSELISKSADKAVYETQWSIYQGLWNFLRANGIKFQRHY